MEKNKVVFVITVFNEEKTIKEVVNVCKKYGDVIVINDSSTDSTLQIVKRLNIHFLNNNKNLGYEASLFKCLYYAVKNFDYDYFITLDGDGQFNEHAIKKALKQIKNNKIFISGIRNIKNRKIEILADKIFYRIFKIHDPLCGLKIYSRKILKLSAHKNLEGLLGMNMILFCLINKVEIHQFKINIQLRKGESTFGGIFKSNLFIGLSLFKFFYKYVLYK